MLRSFGPYLNGHAEQYVYRVKGKDTSKHIRQIGIFMQRLLVDLKEAYAEETVYQVLECVFGEHYCPEGQEVLTKTGDQMSASSLQSPDDLEVAYREKAGRSHRRYMGNITESCDPENSFQLITKVQVEPNNTDDAQMLVEALPNLKVTCSPKTNPLDKLVLWVKGGRCYGKKRYSPEQIITKLQEAEVQLSQEQTIAQACKSIEVGEQTYYRWRREYGGMDTTHARKLKELEKVNSRLKKLVVDLSLDMLS